MSNAKRKVLFISNIGAKRTGSFSFSAILASRDIGLEFHIAANFSSATPQEMIEDEKQHNIRKHHINLVRNPLHPGNIKAYRELVKLITREKYDLIHCNTPVGGLLGRLAAKKCGIKMVIYQARGFHFYNGAPYLYWLLYYPVERLLANLTDAIITINHEDYERAQGFKLRNRGKVYFIHGAGIDTAKYSKDSSIDKAALRTSLELTEEDIVLIAMGDLIKRKNYRTSIQALAKADKKVLHFLICGKGPMLDSLTRLSSDIGLENRVHLLGHRLDVAELMHIADIFLFTTLQEGLPRSMMEAMAAGLPCIASKIRGNIDLIEDGIGGYLVCPTDTEGFSERINELAANRSLRDQMGRHNKNTIKNYDVSIVKEELKSIYKEVLFKEIAY